MMFNGGTDGAVNSLHELILKSIRLSRRWLPPGSISEVLEQFEIDLGAGRVISCPHLDNPQPVTVDMTFPDRMFCHSCAVTEIAPDYSELRKRRDCVACGASRVALVSTALPVGAVTLVGRLCWACR